MGVWMEGKVKTMTLDQLHDEKRELREILGGGNWKHGKPKARQVEAYNGLLEDLRDVEEEIELRVFGEVLLY